MDSDERHVYGPRPVGALMPRLTRAAFRRRAPATAQVLADWAAIVGPAIAAVTTPRRLAAGTLTIACAGPIAMELQHLSGEVIARINAHLGSQAVATLRFVQTPELAQRRSPRCRRRPIRRSSPRSTPPWPDCPRANCATRWPRWAAPCSRLPTDRGTHDTDSPFDPVACRRPSPPA